MFKKYFVEEVIKQIEHPNNIKRWKAIENAIYVESVSCNKRNCSNLICYMSDTSDNYEKNITLLYVTDINGKVLDDVSPYHVNYCDTCSASAFFCNDSCMYGDEEICYDCRPTCVSCNTTLDVKNTYTCYDCGFCMCSKHVTTCKQCEEFTCSKCMKKDICIDCE